MSLAIRREYGRIYFGDGADRWSVTDPEAPEHQFFVRDLMCDWLYMIDACPSTKTALGKVRLIRRALRTVERVPNGNGHGCELVNCSGVGPHASHSRRAK